MAAQDVIKQLIHEFETLLATFPLDLPRAREMASRWMGQTAPSSKTPHLTRNSLA